MVPPSFLLSPPLYSILFRAILFLHLKKALTKDPTHGPCWTAYAVIEDRCGNHDDARRILEQG